jgi:polyphosphate glucokinase
VTITTARTLCIDIGGTGIKGIVYDPNGAPLSERVRIETPRPATPPAVIATIERVAAGLGAFDRVGIGFPGVVIDDTTQTAPNLDEGWAGFRLGDALATRFGKPVRVANDADVHGLAVIQGRGVEMVLTLGTGLGSALYVDGHLVQNLELGHHPFGKHRGESYEDRVCDKVRKEIGSRRWNKRVVEILQQIQPIFNPRRIFVGGGNARRLEKEALPENVTIVDNVAGLLGGVKLFAAARPGAPEVRSAAE